MTLSIFHDYTLSISGLKYLKNHYGPTPIKHELLLGELFDKYITYKVDYVNSSEECIEEYETIKPLEKPNLSIFSKEEINSINKVLKSFKFLTSEKISEYSHQEKAWKETKVKQLINYKYAKDMMLFK